MEFLVLVSGIWFIGMVLWFCAVLIQIDNDEKRLRNSPQEKGSQDE